MIAIETSQLSIYEADVKGRVMNNELSTVNEGKKIIGDTVKGGLVSQKFWRNAMDR
jgi:hypothetical protein